MLTGEARDETTATDLTSSLEPAVGALKIAEGWESVLEIGHTPEDDTPASQEPARNVLDVVVRERARARGLG